MLAGDYDYSWIWSEEPCTPSPLFGKGLTGHIVSPGDMRKWTTRFAKSVLGNTPSEDGKGWGMPNGADCFGCKAVETINEDRGGCKNFEAEGAYGACSGMGVAGTVTADWIQNGKKTDRYLYLDAMADLFDEFAARALGCDPTLDNEYGQCCLPDRGPTKVFTRCCADHVKQYCASCPPGKPAVSSLKHEVHSHST